MTSDDDAFLDGLFDEFVAQALEGVRVDLDARLAGRTHLLPRARELLALATRVAGSRVGGAALPLRVAGYAIERELGRGATSVVFLARQASLGDRRVALKILNPATVPSSRERRRFLAEASALARVRHDHVIAVHDVIAADDLLGYAMEWIDGCSLRDLIDQRARGVREGLAALPQAQWVPFVCRTGVALARALACVHAAGLLHRDVKPGNVLVRSDGVPVLADFGLVRDDAGSMETRAGTFLGTLVYAAPEQVRGEALDVRADVYGLAAALHHALTLAPPVQGATTAAILAQIEAGRVRPLRQIDRSLPRDLETVIGKAMEPDPRRRYADAAAFADDIERVLGLQPIRARPPGLLGRSAKALRRNRRVVAGVAAGALVTVLLMVALRVAGAVEERARMAVARELRAARLALLDPGLRARVERMRLGEGAPDAMLAASVAAAAAHCARVLAIDPTRADAVALHAVLDAAQARMHGEVHAAASVTDPIAIGVAAFLAGSFEAALQQLEPVAVDNAFADGLVGQAHLALGRPERAYPRLARVAAAFPEAGHLQAAAADAALRCGDAAFARRLLAQARAAATPAAADLVRRLDADLAWLAGRRDEALAVYTGPLAVTELGYLRRTQMLEAGGRHADAVMGYINLLLAGVDDEGRRNVIRAARGYWSSLSDMDRRRMLTAELAGAMVPGPPLLGVMAVVLRARGQLDRTAGDGPPAFTVDRDRVLAAEPGGIEAVALRVDADRLDLARCASADDAWRERLVAAWLDPVGGVRAEEQTVAAGARLAPDRRAFERDLPPIAPPWRLVARLPDIALARIGAYGEPVASVGDVDGDAIADVLLGHRAEPDPAARGAVTVCSGADGAPRVSFVGDGAFDGLGFAVAAGDDANLLVAALPGDGRPGFAERRGADGRLRDRVHGEDASQSFARCVASLGDVDGDGCQEIAIGAPGPGRDGEQRGRVEVWSAPGRRRFVVEGERPHDSLGEFLACLGDVDGDGAADFAAGTLARAGASAYGLVLSGRSGTVLQRVAPPGCGPALRVAAAGDADGDGRPDLAIAWTDADDVGHVEVRDARSGAVLRACLGRMRRDGFGADVSNVGDVDGDGRADLAVTTWSEVSLLPPDVRILGSTGVEFALPGFWRLRRLPSPRGTTARFAALALVAWSRFAETPMGTRACGAIVAFEGGSRR